MKLLIILILLVLGLSGCATTASYTGPAGPVLANIPGVYHRVEAGQTLWRISKMYDIDLDDILRVNRNLEAAKIEVGQSILIPNRRIASNPSSKFANDDFIWPLKGKILTSYGLSYHYLVNKGLNIQPYADRDVVAARSGRVVFYASDFGNFGKVVIIDHGDGLRSIYARNSEVYVKAGEIIKQGAIISRAGSTQGDKHNYLHFEIRKGPNAQNPLYYLP